MRRCGFDLGCQREIFCFASPPENLPCKENRETPMISNQFAIPDSRRSGAWKYLAAGVATILLLTGGIASAQPVSFKGQTFVNYRLEPAAD